MRDRRIGETGVTAEAAAHLRDAIRDGRLAPGARIVERPFAQELGISAIAVRDALARLTQEGWVERLPRRGARVRDPTPAELDDIYASLNQLSVALGPKGANKGGKTKGALSTLLNVSAANLKGNGAALGNSITQLSRAARTLSDSRGDLFQTVANLRTFTGALKTSDGQVRLFNRQLAQVAGDLAGESITVALAALGAAGDQRGAHEEQGAQQGSVVPGRATLELHVACRRTSNGGVVHEGSPCATRRGCRRLKVVTTQRLL